MGKNFNYPARDGDKQYTSTYRTPCRKEKQCQEALRLLEDMESMNLPPRSFSVYSPIIDFHGFNLSLCKVYLMKHVWQKTLRRIIADTGKHSIDTLVLKEGVSHFLYGNYV